MLPHHQQTIDNLTAHIAAGAEFDALIIGGSVAKGLARPDSDIDFLVIANDAAYARRVPERPAELMTLAEHVLADPSKAHADAFRDAVFSFTDWPQPPEGWPARFMQDSEWAWREGRAALADC